MADGAHAQGIGEVVDPGGILRSALEKIVFFESRVSPLEFELGAARVVVIMEDSNGLFEKRCEIGLILPLKNFSSSSPQIVFGWPRRSSRVAPPLAA